MFDFVLGTNSSTNTYQNEPGVRVVNTVGDVAFKHDAYGYYYGDLGNACAGGIPTLEAFYPDR